MDAISRLQAVDFLQHLALADFEALSRITRRQRFVAGQDIIQQGDLTDRFFIVDEGQVHFRKTDLEGFEKAIGVIGPGGHFGKAMFTTQEPTEYTAEAVDEAWLYVISCEDFEKVTQADPGLLKRMPEVTQARTRLTRGFGWLTPGEIVAFTTHRHPLLLIQALMLPILAGVLLIGLILLLDSFGALGSLGGTGTVTILILVSILIPLAWGTYIQFDWNDDDFIVTNKRVVHSERAPFGGEVRNEIPISKIQSITVEKTTPIQAALGVSNLVIQSGSQEQTGIRFDHVANAGSIRQLIERQRSALRARQQAEERERFRRRVGSELRHYVSSQPFDEAPPTPPPARRQRTLGDQMHDAWRWMFGRELHTGNVITWRKHWVALLRQIWRWLLLIIVLLGATVIYAWNPVLQALPFGGVLAVWGTLFAFALGGLLWQWDDWRNDIYQVTDSTVVDIERLPLGFDSKETTALLVNVQDARAIRTGIIRTMFNYGDVEISTAGGGASLVFHDVSRPQEIQAEIFRRLEAVRLKQRERETGLQSRNIVDALVAYHRLLTEERHAGTGATTTTTVEQAKIGPPPAPQTLIETTIEEEPIFPVIRDRDDELWEFPPPSAYGDETQQP